MQTETPPAEAEPPAPPPRRRLPRPDPVLVVCALVLVAFPFAATLSASGQPITSAAGAGHGEPRGRAGGSRCAGVQPGGAAAVAVADGALLNDVGAMRARWAPRSSSSPPQPRAAFKAFLVEGGPRLNFVEPTYPFHWFDVDAVLDVALPAELDQRRRSP